MGSSLHALNPDGKNYEKFISNLPGYPQFVHEISFERISCSGGFCDGGKSAHTSC